MRYVYQAQLNQYDGRVTHYVSRVYTTLRRAKAYIRRWTGIRDMDFVRTKGPDGGKVWRAIVRGRDEFPGPNGTQCWFQVFKHPVRE